MNKIIPVDTQSTSAGDLFCRICLKNDSSEKIICPCICKGQLSYAHESCLMEWGSKSEKIKFNEKQESFSLECIRCRKEIPIFKLEEKRLKTCQQIKETIINRKGKFILEVFSVILCMLSMGYLCKKIITETSFKNLVKFDIHNIPAMVPIYLPLVSVGGAGLSAFMMIVKFLGEYFMISIHGFRINLDYLQRLEKGEQSQTIILSKKPYEVEVLEIQ